MCVCFENCGCSSSCLKDVSKVMFVHLTEGQREREREKNKREREREKKKKRRERERERKKKKKERKLNGKKQ